MPRITPVISTLLAAALVCTCFTSCERSVADTAPRNTVDAPEKTLRNSTQPTSTQPTSTQPSSTQPSNLAKEDRAAEEPLTRPEALFETDEPVTQLTDTQVAQVAPDAAAVALADAPPQAKVKVEKPDPSDEFFEKGPIPTIKIQLSQQQEQKLRADQRRFVDCIVIEDGTKTYKKVHVKLKGAAGSFRNLDDRPALTIKMKDKDDRFHGMDKFYLNNSVQDESYLCEWLGSQLCRQAGVPAPRVSHARVWINNRDLGFYVLKEGFDSRFIKRHFPDAKGNLYDGGFCVDIDANLEKDDGDGPDDLSDLKALVAACREGDVAKRTQLLSERLDIDAFLNFVAIELMMCHWDGYVGNKNNYRIYFRPDTNKAVFLPQGMDQLFQDANFSLFHEPGQIAANPVMKNAEWKSKYRQRVKELLPMFEKEKLHALIDTAHARMRPAIAAIHEDRAKQFDQRALDMKNRVAPRAEAIRNQIRNLPPEPLLFTKVDSHLLEDWLPKPEGDTKLEERDVDGKKCYVIETGPSNRTTASWRRKALLVRGSYRIEAQVKATNVTALEEPKGKGIGLRMSGGQREGGLIGTTGFQTISSPLEIANETQEVELVAEMRATSGFAAFDKSSFKIVKVK